MLYALALEKLFPGTGVESGRLYYCTERGGYEVRSVALDQPTRDAAQTIAEALKHHLREGFFPAAPREGACTYCDYKAVCGPNEVERISSKRDDGRLSALKAIRRLR